MCNFCLQIPLFNCKLKFILLLMTIGISLLLAKSNLTVILTGGVGKNGSSVAVSYLFYYNYLLYEQYF